MQRTGIAADNAMGIAEESAERAELTIIQNWAGTSAGAQNLGSKRFLAGAVVNDAGKAEFGANFLAKGAKSLGRPTLRAPTAPGAEDNIAAETVLL
jgi:hypothetical protein